jgi:FG-GAP repeat.
MRRGIWIVFALILSAVACSTSAPTASPPSPSPSRAPGSPIQFMAGQVRVLVSDPANVAVADLNGDGKLDLAIPSQSEPVVVVLLGRGDGTFGQTLTIPAGQGGNFILAADLDGDGHVDLATSDQDGSATVLWGNGDGTFSTPVSYDVKGHLALGTAQWLAAADFNGDVALDLVVSVLVTSGASGDDPLAPGQVAVLLNKGGRTFAAPVFYADRAAVAVVAGDFDSDGKVDVATADLDRTVRIFRGDGKGRLGPSATYAIDGRGVAIAAGDFNGDGVLDLATGNDRSFSVSVLLGLGHGTFGRSVHFEAGNTHTIAVVDLDRDGHLDLIAGGFDETFIRFLRGRGDGAFLDQVKIDTSVSTARGVAAADLNGDQQLDLAVTDGVASVQVFIGN